MAAATATEPEPLESRLELRVLDSLDQVDAQAPAWRALFDRVPSATAFDSFEWNRALAAYEAPESALRVLVARAPDGATVGIAPLCLRRGPLPGVRALGFIGSDRSDYRGFLVDPRHRTAFARSLARWVATRQEARVVSLGGLRPPDLELLSGCGFLEAQPVDVSPIARLPESLAEYERNVMHGKLREAVLRENRRLVGRVDCSVSRVPGELEADLSILFDLHQRRQRARGERGRFFEQRWQRAFRELSGDLLRRGLLRLGVLRIDGRVAAVSCNLRSPDCEIYYIGGFEADLARHSPGSLLQHRMIGNAIEEGVRIYDFGRGQEAYKARWCNDRAEQFRIERARPRVLVHAVRARRSARSGVYRSRLLKRVYLLLSSLSTAAAELPPGRDL